MNKQNSGKKLVAIYIPQGVLTYIFGKEHKGQTINLGGKYLYQFVEVDEAVELHERHLSPTYLEGFWLNDISLMSAIVGENGVGKSSLLNIFRDYTSFCSYIYMRILKTTNISLKRIVMNMK